MARQWIRRQVLARAVVGSTVVAVVAALSPGQAVAAPTRHAALLPAAGETGTPSNAGAAATSGTGLTAASVTLTEPIPAGDTAFAVLELKFSTAPTAFTFSDDAGNTWSTDVAYGAGGGTLARAVLTSGLATGQHVTATWSGSGDVSSAKMVVDVDAGAWAPDGTPPGKTSVSGARHHVSVAEKANDLMYGFDFATSKESTVTTSGPYAQLGKTADSKSGLVTAYNLPAVSRSETFADVWSTSHSGYMDAIAYARAVTAPGAPTSVAAVAGDGQATVSWSAPAFDGGSPVTGYTVTASPAGATAATGGATTATVTGLSNGTAYTFTVTATNSVGTGPVSAASAAVTPAAVPGAPTSVAAVAGDSQASVSWSAPAFDGGSPVTGYTVTASPGGATAATGGATTATVTGLSNGTAYTFTVTATNSVGTGPVSAASAAVTPKAQGASDGPGPMARGLVRTLVGDGVASTVAGAGTGASLDGAHAIAVIGGSAFTATSDAIVKTDVATGVTTVLAGTPGTSGCADGADGAVVSVGGVRRLVTDGVRLYAETSCGIRSIDPSSGATSTLWNTSIYRDIAVLADGSLYAVNGTQLYSIDPATDAQTQIFHYSDSACGGGVFSDASGSGQTLYIVINDYDCDGDPYNFRVAALTFPGGIPTLTDPVAGGWGLGQGGMWAVGGEVYVPGYASWAVGNGRGSAGPRLDQLDPATGAVTQVAGSSGGFADGVDTDAWFGSIDGVAGDANALYVADNVNDRVRRVTPAVALPAVAPTAIDTADTFDLGAVYPVVGDGQAHTTAGTWTGAGTNAPTGVTSFGGHLFVADDDAVSDVDLSTGAAGVLAGTPGAPGETDGTSGSSSTVGGGQAVTDGYFVYTLAGGLVRRTSIATGATTTVGSSDAPYNVLEFLAMGADGQLYAANNAGEILRMDPRTGAFADLPITVPTTGCEGPAVTGLAVDSTSVYVAGQGESCGNYFTYNRFIDKFSLSDGSMLGQVVVDGTGGPGGAIAAVGDSVYYSDYRNNEQELWRVGKDLTGATVVAGGFPSIDQITSDGQRVWIASTTANQVYDVVQAEKGPLAAGGPSRIGETWGCGPASENATQPACKGFVDPASGAAVTSDVDVAVPGRGPGLVWARSYDSMAGSVDGPLGYGWATTYSMKVVVDPYDGSGALASSPVVDVVEESGSRIPFVRNSNGSYTAPSRVQATLTPKADGSWEFVRRATDVFDFDATGRLTAQKDLNGYATTLAYNSAGQLATATDAAGRQLTFSYGSNGKIQWVKDPMGRQTSYGYDANGNLTSVTDPMTRQTTYGYDSWHAMTSLKLPAGGLSSNTFDSAHRILTHVDGLQNLTQFTYSAPTAPGSYTITRVDPTGSTTVDVYSDGELTSSTAAYGTSLAATTKYEYDPVSNGLTKTTDPLGHVTSATYDARGNKLTSTDADQRTTTWTYNALNEPLTVKDPMNVVTTNTYDAAGNLLTSSTPVDASTTAETSNTYGDAAHPGDVTASTDADTRTTQYGYDAYGNKTSVTDPAGDETTYGYNLDGEQTTTVAPDGNVDGCGCAASYTTTTVRDDDGEATSVTDPLGHKTSYGYDDDGNRTTVTDPTGLVTTSVYGATDLLSSVTTPAGVVTSYTYDGDGRKHTVYDAANNTTTWDYDALGRPTKLTDPTTAVTQYFYDLAGRLTTTQQPNGGQTVNVYDDAGQLTKSTSPISGVTKYEYDADGRKTKVTDPDGNVTQYAYDNLGRQTVTTRADTTTTTNTYDKAGQLLSYEDGGTNVTGYTYDLAGREKTVVDPDQRTTSYGYDASGNRTTVTDPLQRVTTNVYDRANRLTAVQHSDGTTPNISYSYDDAGRRLTMTDGTGATSYGYDQYGRVSTVTDGAGAVVGYSYDTLGHIATVTYPDTHAITRQYDKAGRLQSVTDWNNQTTRFGYDGDGNLRTTTYPNGVVDTVGVDAGDNATSIVVANGANTLASFGYTYTPSGLVDTTVDSLAPQTKRSYGYNKLHQLVGLDTQTTAYAYDHADNLNTLPDGSTMTYDPAGQLQTRIPTSGTATDFGFDGNGNRTTAAGGATATYSYNQSNQLTTSTTPAGTATYSYNGDGLRASSSDGGGSYAFAWDQLTASLPLLVADGASDYIYGPNDKVVEQVAAASGTTTYLHQDRLGSTRLLTDTAGVTVGTASYDPYGNLVASDGAARSPFGYDGEYTDPTGLIYLRSRYYDASTGQFLTIDPVVDTTRAAYKYAGDNPINAVDPSGKDPCSAGGGGGCNHDGTDPAEVDTPAAQSETAAERAAQLVANREKGLQQEADIARATGLTKNTRLYRTEIGGTYPDFTDLHCGTTACVWEVFESKNIAEVNWGAKQFMQYTREALVAARGVPYGVNGSLNIVISMDSQVNNVDLKQAREFYAQQFKVRLNIYRFNPATGEFMPYGAAPNDLPLRYTAGDGWQFSGESGVMSGDALDGSDTSSGTSPEGGVMRGGGGGGE